MPEPGGARRRVSLAGAVSAAPDLVLGVVYAAALADRTVFSEGLNLSLARAIPIEFAAIHASGFLAWPWIARWTGRRKVLFVAGLAAAYTVVLLILSFAFKGWWPLAIFWGLMANRMLAVLIGDVPEDSAFTEWGIAWAGTTTAFVVGVLAGIFGGQDLAVQALLTGFVYFTLTGISELTHWAWVHRWMHNARARSTRRS